MKEEFMSERFGGLEMENLIAAPLMEAAKGAVSAGGLCADPQIQQKFSRKLPEEETKEP